MVHVVIPSCPNWYNCREAKQSTETSARRGGLVWELQDKGSGYMKENREGGRVLRVVQ